MAVSLLAYWIGGASSPPGAAASGGVRSLLAPWIGGASSPPGAPATSGGFRSLLAFWAGGATNGTEAPPSTPTARGTGGGFRRPLIAVIEVDGKSYRVPIDKAQEFFDVLKARVKELPKPKFKRAKKKGKIVKEVIEPIKIVIKSAPVEYFTQIEAMVDRTNEIFNTIWNRALQKYLLELDDEEAILLLIH